jgi:hypothetical protein
VLPPTATALDTALERNAFLAAVDAVMISDREQCFCCIFLVDTGADHLPNMQLPVRDAKKGLLDDSVVDDEGNKSRERSLTHDIESFERGLLAANEGSRLQLQRCEAIKKP